MHELSNHTEKCLLAGITWNDTRWQTEEHLTELADLAKTAGAEVIHSFIQEKKSPDPAYFIGKGKVNEIKEFIEDHTIDLLIFDEELTPAQVKNLEAIIQIKVMDRSGLILDIFAAHARTKEAKTQVELAQLEYLLPRLTRQWTHLSRQVGGIGTKGPGETQLETDRRLVRSRIDHLQNTLANIAKQKAVQRKRSQEFLRLALVGYTNAGKSTLLNVLTNSKAYVADQLFATLDTTVRRLDYSGFTLLVSDTVGFIRKLPHELVASFRTTLAQTAEADLLLHVIDITDEALDEKIEIVNNILKDMNISDIPYILVMNKLDLEKNSSRIARIKQRYPDACFISARKKIRLDNFKQVVINKLNQSFESMTVSLNYTNEYEILSKLAKWGTVLGRDYTEENVEVKFRYHKKFQNEIEKVISNHNLDII
jgi:GTP-binding protein HflX